MEDDEVFRCRTVEDLQEVACPVGADAEFSRPVAFRIKLDEARAELPRVLDICGRDAVPQSRRVNIHIENIFQLFSECFTVF